MSLRDWFAEAATATPATPATVTGSKQPSVATVATVAVANTENFPEIGDSGDDAAADPDVMRRRSRALAMLAEHPEQRIAVVAERGNPAHVTVAVRDVAVGDIEIPADSYDGFALLALMNQYGHA